jgi:putative endonuclease
MNSILSLGIENKYPPAASLVGETGEHLAAEFLKRNGYEPVLRNFKTPIGRNRRGAQVTGEIDIVALDGETLCFVEVKTRSSDAFAAPAAAVDLRKQRQITRAGRVYRKIFDLRRRPVRYDVVSIVLRGKKAPQIELFKGFWTEEKFKKKVWADDI